MSIELATPTFSNGQICAHRGASGSYPENTRAAFDAAASIGAGWIETDIQCLADGELVIFHDAHLGRTAPGPSKVTSLRWPDMAKLDIGSWKGATFAAERPLRCEDLIAWQRESPGRPGIMWEVKCDDDPVAVDAVAAAVAQRLRDAGAHRCVVSSFSRDVLSALRLQLPAIPMALIAEAMPEDGVAFCQEHGLEGMHLDGHQVTHESARAVLNAGFALRCYTINDMREAERLVALGVSMIMTDFPEQFLSQR
ncbi:MAG: glycerophosphodiester phosphodiesterase family protein [Luminiphilus sp.]|nr:glycerophosphodiester phosphodiesterase family protein [Luminiphilus sp.]